jgi:cytochrome b subunit of formate dehydrogenase
MCVAPGAHGWRLLALLVPLMLSVSHVAADEISNDTCLACHSTPGFAGPTGRVVFVDASTFGASVHGSLPCTMCHTDVTTVPHAETLHPVSMDVCEPCHGAQVGAFRKGIHGQARAQGVTEAPSCSDCHGEIHAVVPHTDPRSAAHWSNLAATCARCHARLELSEKFHIPVVQPVEAYLQSAHARAVAAGRRGAVCSDCHRAHEILPASDPTSSIARMNVAATCGQCHATIEAAYRQSIHGQAVAHGAADAPVCTDCHGEHRILAPASPSSPVFAANIPRETCGRCHGSERLSERYGLPVANVRAFQDSYHGLALRGGQLTVANCSSCHGAHDILPSTDPHSHVNKANLPQTCGKCHPGAGTRFPIGSVHGLPTAFATQVTGWVRFAYVWLIGLVIGFMAAHNLLDLGRKMRRPVPPAHWTVEYGPERMPRVLRWQHGLVMLSVPVLVYTGFALTYPDSWWATPLLRWEPHIRLRALLHRAAAVVLLSGLLWHLGQLALSRCQRACLRGIGWSWTDARHFGSVLAYYLGVRSTAPHGGKFSYIEKAEYWAFLWGTGVMAVTGFLLWFTDLTLRYLPKWVTDVATAFHFYEAVLATLSILVWHFYWVIFDPDVYPMDWSWWNGRSPSSRVIERGQAEVAEESSPGDKR